MANPRRAAAALLAALALAVSSAPVSRASESPNPISWYSGYFDPQRPLPGKKLGFTIWVQNISPNPTPAGKIALFSNASNPAACGAAGDAEFKIPPLDPLEVAAVKVSVKVPSEPGTYTFCTFVDSTCAIFAGSSVSPSGFGNQGNQRCRSFLVSANKTTNIGVSRSPPSQMPLGGPYVQGNIRTVETEPMLPQAGQDFVAYVKVANWGTAPLEPGTRVAVFNNVGSGIAQPPCGVESEVSVTLSKKLAPGKEITIEVPLQAPGEAGPLVGFAVFVDADCREDSDIGRSGRVALFSYPVSPGPIPHFATVYQSPDQFVGSIKLKPSKPVAAKNITFSVKLTNNGAVDSAPGVVAVWVQPFSALSSLYAPYMGDYCAFEGTVVSPALDAPVVKAGKSKTVKVTVPAEGVIPGTFVVSIVASSANCSSNVGQPIFPSYLAFTVPSA